MKKDSSFNKVILGVLKGFNLILIMIPFAIGWYSYYRDTMKNRYHNLGNLLVLFVFIILYMFFARTYDAFWVSINRIREIIYSQFLAAFMADAIMYLVTVLLAFRLVHLFPMLLVLVGQILMSTVWATLVHIWYFKVTPAKKSAVIYDQDAGLEQKMSDYGYDKKFQVMFTLYVKDCLNDLSCLDECEAVFLSGIHSKDRNIILKYCMYRGIRVYVIPRVGDVLMSSAEKMHMFHMPILKVDRYEGGLEYEVAKRIFDIILSACAIIVLSPFMIITALAIKTDGGPAFYKQKRLTKDGKVFEILKFRSMRVDAEKDGVARLSTGNKDDRITPVGKVIRAIRFDELPQLFNILKGDMTIVGPRPERPEIAKQYEEALPEFSLRLQVKAGLTGYAQVYGKYNTTPYDKLKMDLMYIASASFLEDLKICFATVKILFIPESTEGVAEGSVTAMGKNVCNKAEGKEETERE